MPLKIWVFSIAFLVPQFVSAGASGIDFDSMHHIQIETLLAGFATNVPAVQSPPRPVVEAYGEADDGKLTKLSPMNNTKDRDSDGKHYTWIPGLKSAVFTMTCESPGSSQYTWQLRLMKPINMPERAGHDHAIQANLPTAAKYVLPPNLQAGASYYIDNVLWSPQFNYMGEALTGLLNPKSVITLKIPDPKYATSIALPLQYSGACNSAETRYMDIMISDLVPLSASGTTYVLIGGEKGKHTHYSGTHYGTVETIAAIRNLADRWRATHPNSYKLAINDISLPWGGSFDLQGDWNHNSSHFNHSFGISVDIRKRCVKKSERPALIKLMGELGFTVKSEGDPYITKPGTLAPDKKADHYHIQFKPELDRLRNLKIPPNNIPFPIAPNGAMNGVNVDLEQFDTGGDGFLGFQSNKATDNCQMYMAYANDCSTPSSDDERRYCHCIGLFDGLSPEEESYVGCQK